MKNFKSLVLTLIGMLALIVCASMFTACTQDEHITITNQSEEDSATYQIAPETRAMNTVYYTIPSSGTLPNSVDNLPAVCGGGQYVYGGAVTADISKSGNTLIAMVKKQVPMTTFTYAGTAYLKYAHPCGTVLDSAPYSANASYVFVSYDISTPNLTYGAYTIYPMVKNSPYPYNRYYAEPILVRTSSYIDGNFTYGHTLGTFNGVEVICNNNNSNQSSDSTHVYQCTEFCIRYINQVYGANIIHYQDAYTWFSSYTYFPSSHFIRYNNGSSSSSDPHPGDILCMSGGPKGKGHVAIVMYVNGSTLLIAQQNSGSNTSGGWGQAIGGALTYNSSTKTISDPNTTYTVQGWMRYMP